MRIKFNGFMLPEDLVIFAVLAPHLPPARLERQTQVYMFFNVVCVGIAVFCSSAPELYVHVRTDRFYGRCAQSGGHKRRP